jgi:hypothetical protein
VAPPYQPYGRPGALWQPCPGEAPTARDLDQDTLERRRHVLGHDHPDTLYSAHNLAADLRELGEAADGP